MPLEREKQGLELKEYKDKLSDGTYALRVGKEVPEGSVNLAYVHTPQIQSDENISLVDTSYTSDNVIPQDQLESMVVANEKGELEYVDIIGNGEVRPRPPRNTFPSKKVNVTRTFKKNEMRTENALYYKFEIDYHYDSKKAIPNDDGTYSVEKYTGQQIELTDENGNLLDDTYKYDIYVQPHAANPNIYSIRIYLHKNTNRTETIKVRYNHIDAIVRDEDIVSVRNQIEFYTNKNNTIGVDSQGRQMLEGGKLRIINGVSAYDEKTEAEVKDAQSDQEIFAVIPKENGEGYRIVVPQKSEADPRVPRIFSHRVVATYVGADGQEVKVTVGHITDWCINPEALLKNEREEYSGEWKNIGIPVGGVKLNAKEMIELSLPFGTPGVPSNASYYIEDDNGNLLYHITELTDNPKIDTQVNEVMSRTIEAKATDLKQEPWENAMQDNTVIKSNPIPHVCSVIPERQQTKWNFTWKANGQGYTERKTSYKTSWQVCADVAFNKTVYPHNIDVLDKSKWATIGNSTDIQKWQYSYVPEMKKNVLEYLDPVEDIAGFYQKKEMIDYQLTDLMDKKDYTFSTKVRMTDPIDDDVIGVMFRVRDSQNYYMFVWEKNDLQTSSKTYEFDHGEGIVGEANPCERVFFDEHGFRIFTYDPNSSGETWRVTNNKTKYLNQGFGTKHKRLMKATPSKKSPSPNPDDPYNWNGVTRYPTDRTSCQFEDITDMSATYKPQGWEVGKDYKITVSVVGDLFRVYISDNPDSSNLGQLVCQGKDSTHQKGTYGILNVSQRWTYWYDLMMTEIVRDTICSESVDVVLTDTTEKKLSNYTVTDMMEPLIDAKARESFDGASYEVFEYKPKTDGEFTLRIDDRTDFLYGRTNNPVAGGIVRTEWTTDQNGLTVHGTGQVEYHADGHFTIITNPSFLPTEQVPNDVLGFSWNKPEIVSGENISISLIKPDRLQLSATVPPIRLIGRPYVLSEAEILKSDGFKHMEYLFDSNGEEGFYEKLDIPSNIPKDEILLRIERGEVTGVNEDGMATTENPEHRVNYRFRCEKDGFTRMPVDQFQDQLGVNRLRLKSIMSGDDFDPTITVDVAAWTTFQELEAVPLFAVKVDESRKIEIEKPRLEQKNMELDNWYLRVKNGRFLKRLILPYFEPGSREKLPEIYVTYPELLGLVKSSKDVVEVDLEYNLDENDQYKLEYRDQEFHNRPYVLVDKESPVILNEYAIQTRYAPIVLRSITGMSYLEVYSIRANQRRELRVSDVDAVKGIIYLHDRIREQDEVYVRYAYQEDWYNYRGFIKEEASYNVIPQEKEVTLEATMTAKVIGSTSSREWVPPKIARYYGMGGGLPLNGSNQRAPEGSTVANSLWDHYDNNKRKGLDIFSKEPNKELDFLYISEPYINHPIAIRNMSEETRLDVERYLFEFGKFIHFKGVISSYKAIERAPAIEGYNYFTERFGVRFELLPDVILDTNSTVVNDSHPLLEEYVPNGKEFKGSYGCRLVLEGPHVTPLAWSDETKKDVIFAAYQNEGRTILFDCVSGLYNGSDRGWQAMINTIHEKLTESRDGYFIEHREEEVKVLGPLTKKVTETLKSGYDVSERCMRLSISVTELEGWDEFKNKYQGLYNGVIAEPTTHFTLSGATPSREEIVYTYGPGGGTHQYLAATMTACTIIQPKYEKIVHDRKWFHLDLNPTPGHRHTIAENGIHRWIPIDRDTEKYTQKEVSNKELLVKQIHVYMRPSVIRYVDSNNPALHGQPIPGTLRDKVLYHTDEESWFNPKDYKYDPTMLRLGKVTLQANSTIHDNMTILDTRTRGGGLDESLSRDIIRQVNEESLYHWDIGYFDGEAYQENGVIIIRLPRSILKSEDNPNGFHESQVQEAVAKHKAYGVLPIIEYYDEVKTEASLNMLSNSEFMYGNHIGYFDPAKSSGNFEVRHMVLGSGDNYVLQVEDKAEYAITVPGYRFKDNQYRIEIKAMKDQDATSRSAGVVSVHYKDGTVTHTQLPILNRNQWMVYKEAITIEKEIHHMTIRLNKAPENRVGKVLFDYVMLYPSAEVSDETTEIHEI